MGWGVEKEAPFPQFSDFTGHMNAWPGISNLLQTLASASPSVRDPAEFFTAYEASLLRTL